MRGAAMERLSKIISDTPTRSDGSGDKSRKPLLEMGFGLSEGWLSLVLLAAVVYSTVWCVQAVGWVDHMGVLTLTTALGLVIGVVAAKQRRFPQLPVHAVVLLFGILLAFWQTAGAYYGGDTQDFLLSMQRWFATVSIGGVGDEDAIFLFFIVALGFLLAYTSAWLVYRARNPWLMIVANAVVLLINLSNVDNSFIFFLVVFLLSALLLVLRFNLVESMQRWQRQGLRYSEDLNWDVMQAGALISVGILIFSWLLPAGYLDPTASQIWNASSNPFIQLQNTWNRIVSVSGGTNPANSGNFRSNLVLGGNPNLDDKVVFRMKVDSKDYGQYLVAISYDTYDGKRGWTNGDTESIIIKNDQATPIGSIHTRNVKQTITVVNAPALENPYLFGSSEIIQTNVPSKVEFSRSSGEAIAWLNQNGFLTAGTTYNVVSSVSSATVEQLRSIPLPKDSPKISPEAMRSGVGLPVSYYSPGVLSRYTQLPKQLDPRITQKALEITANQKTPYDKVVALENYLRTSYKYSVDIKPPSGKDAVAWFLFDNPDKTGFCNYFASSMTVMARSLGLPARVVVGYNNGELDAKTGERVIRGKNAHAWTQVYFAGYGWVNFEPSSIRSPFVRPVSTAESGGTSTDATSSNDTQQNGSRFTGRGQDDKEVDVSGIDATTTQSPDVLVRQGVGIATGGLVLLLLFASILFFIWWRKLFSRYSLAAQLYGRICVMANWAGIKLTPSQTPYECVQELAVSAPREAPILEKLGDIYVRERWADPSSKEHPRATGEVEQLPKLWRALQPRLFLFVLRHPYFLHWIPERVSGSVSTFKKWRRRRKLLEQEI